MGLLSPEDYKNAIKNVPQKTAPATPTQTPTATAEPVKQGIFDNTQNNPVVDYVFNFAKKAAPLTVPGTTPVEKKVAQPLTGQQQVERYGYEVGSTEYYRNKAEHPYLSFAPQQIGSALGLEFPDMETWDKMSRTDQVAHTAAQSLGATMKLVLSLPKVAAETVVRYGTSVVRPWVDLAAGKPVNWETVKDDEVTVPWLGTVGSYWKNYDEAKKSGLGTAGATLATGSQMLGDVTLIPALAEAVVKSFQPRTALKEGETVGATKPIQTAIVKENEALVAKRGNPDYPGEYYDVPKTVAKEFGGDTNNIKLKVTPASDGAMELSVVKLQGGITSKVVEYFKDKFGMVNKATDGKFGKEIKLKGQIIPGKATSPSMATQTNELIKPELFKEGGLFHGTNKDFAEFSAEKFGSGEGTNLFGEGIYLSDNPKIAEFYGKQSIQTEKYPGVGDLQENINGLKKQITDIEKTKKVKDGISIKEKDERIVSLNQLIDEQTSALKEGRVLQTSIAPDTKLFEIDGVPREILDDFDYLNELGFTNKEIQRFRIDTGGIPAFDYKEFKNVLTQKGYDGIKFPADRIQATGKFDGSNNYVIFNPKKIVIERAQPFMSGGIKEVTIGVDKLPIKEYTKIAEQVYKGVVDNGGITINLKGEVPTKGYAYSPFKDTETVIPIEKTNPEIVGQFIDKNLEKLSQPGHNIGGWIEDGKVYFDISKVGEPNPATIAEAEAANELAVFDLEKFETIYTKHGQKTNVSNINGGEIPRTNSPGGKPSLGEIQEGGIGGLSAIEGEATTQKVIASISPKPLKGFEKKSITNEQLANLDLISTTNGVAPGLRDAVVRTLTGKQVIGELTQADYVNVAQTLARLSNSEKFSSTFASPFFSRYISPTRHWTRSIEEKTGIPIYSDGYIPMETAQRLAKVSEQTQLGKLWEDPIIKKYAKPGFAEERRLVRAYREGNTVAVTDNAALDAATKTELISAAKIFDDYYNKIGPDVGVPVDIFLDQYSPNIFDIGGKFQLYKSTSDMPKQAGFFAKEKRQGSLAILVDDEWALAVIYTRAGYKAKYSDPVLKRINDFYDKMPPEVQSSFKSYVQEKLGYAGEVERALDSISVKLNNKLGLNLPPDIGRRFTNQAMNTMYSSAMSQPATWLRNSFQYPMMGYAYLGPKFAGSAIKKALSKEGMEEFMKSGFNVDLGVPFGEELAQEVNTAGRISNAYKNVTQGVLKPNSIVEAQNRSIVYHQSKMIFEDAISKYNSGKIRWEQVEKELDFNGLRATDRNLIRQDLVSGNMKGAFEKYVQNVIDDTQFPYRRGAEMRLSYGAAGHLGTAFMQWPNEYLHTLSGWAKTGQFDKLIRWWGVTSLITRTFKEEFGWDFSKSFFLGPLGSLSPAPLFKVASEGLTALSNWMNDNEEALEVNKDNLAKQLKLTYPAGVEAGNIQNFFKSYNAGPIGPGGTYPVYDLGGRLKYYGSFKDIFWQAMGMPTIEKTQVNELQKEMINAKFNYTQAKSKVLEYYQQEKYDQANDLIQQYGIKLSPADFDKYYIPLTQRTYDSLPATLKAQFAPKVYPTTNK